MKFYPILFSVRDPIIGNGFVASVAIHGRALLRDEGEGSFWIDGVFPGGMAAGGESRDEALLRFREAYQEILRDFAAEAASFEAFRKEVERFFWQETPGEHDAWKAAVSDLRANADTSDEWLPLRKTHPEPAIRVDCLVQEDSVQEDLAPTRNADETVELAAPGTQDRPAA